MDNVTTWLSDKVNILAKIIDLLLWYLVQLVSFGKCTYCVSKTSRPSKWIFQRGLFLYTFVIIAIGSGHGGSSCCKCHLLWGEICWVIVPQIGRGLEPRAWARCEGCCCRRDRAVDGAHRRHKTKLWRGRKSGPEVERWRLLFAAAASVLTFTDFANLWRRNVWKGNFKCFVMQIKVSSVQLALFMDQFCKTIFSKLCRCTLM